MATTTVVVLMSSAQCTVPSQLYDDPFYPALPPPVQETVKVIAARAAYLAAHGYFAQVATRELCNGGIIEKWIGSNSHVAPTANHRSEAIGYMVI